MKRHAKSLRLFGSVIRPSLAALLILSGIALLARAGSPTGNAPAPTQTPAVPSGTSASGADRGRLPVLPIGLVAAGVVAAVGAFAWAVRRRSSRSRSRAADLRRASSYRR